MGITEDQLEQACLDWFKSINYGVVCGLELRFTMGVAKC